MRPIERLRAAADWAESLGGIADAIRTLHVDSTTLWFHDVTSRELLAAIAQRLKDCRLSSNGGRDPNVQGYIELAGERVWVVAYYTPGMLGRKVVAQVMDVECEPDLAGLLAEFALQTVNTTGGDR